MCDVTIYNSLDMRVCECEFVCVHVLKFALFVIRRCNNNGYVRLSVHSHSFFFFSIFISPFIFLASFALPHSFVSTFSFHYYHHCAVCVFYSLYHLSFDNKNCEFFLRCVCVCVFFPTCQPWLFMCVCIMAYFLLHKIAESIILRFIAHYFCPDFCVAALLN